MGILYIFLQTPITWFAGGLQVSLNQAFHRLPEIHKIIPMLVVSQAGCQKTMCCATGLSPDVSGRQFASRFGL